MKLETKKAYLNQKCAECGAQIVGKMVEAQPNRAGKVKKWRLCPPCGAKIFTKKS